MSQATGDELAAMSSAAQVQPTQQSTTETNQNANDASQASQISQPGANDTTTTNDASSKNGSNDKPEDDGDEKSNDLPPKTDITLTLKGTPEYNAFPFSRESEKFYFMASVQASYFKEKDRAPIDLCCIIDESSSMSGERIKLVKETVKFVLRNLTDKDRFGIVGYGSNAHTRLQLTKMDEQGKKNAEKIVQSIGVSGMTALCEGLEFGIKMMRNRNKDECNQIASVMLFTDGQANVGPTSAVAIQKQIEGRGKNNNSSTNNNNQQMQRQRRGKKKLQLNKVKQVMQQVQGQVQGLVQGQQQAQQQQQQQGNESKQQDIDEKQKEKEKENENSQTKEGSVDYSLPCTINTFGFGAQHNESLLEALAEWGRGMYTFIENTDTIAETFAECLGGLVSIVGRDLKVRVSGLNNVSILRCVSQGQYKVEETKLQQEYTVTIPDIQSEERRDLVFQVKLPKLLEKRDSWPMAQISCEYHNVPKNKKEILSVIGNVNRCTNNDEMGERNDELDAQCNRILASEAMDIADKMAEKGDLTNARKVLSEAKEKIQQSNTFANKKKGYFKYAQNLVADVDDITKDLSNRQSYKSSGGKKLKMSKRAHGMQRSCHSSNYQSQRAYTNSSKNAMMQRFSNK